MFPPGHMPIPPRDVALIGREASLQSTGHHLISFGSVLLGGIRVADQDAGLVAHIDVVHVPEFVAPFPV